MDTSRGPRARYRTHVRAEIRAHAWEQIETAGASALSLKAIAKRMGMTAPALYRYVASRDELLTELILEAYRSLAEEMEAAGAARGDGPDDDQELLRRLALVLRRWALEKPHRYLLLYGTPVPGYEAPPEATVLGQRTLAPAVAAFERIAARAGRGTGTAAALRRAVTDWTRLHGILSLELAGHFTDMPISPADLYEEATRYDD